MVTEKQIERQCVEWVFGLTGGELSDKPLAYTVGGNDDVHSFEYHFDGVPDYCGKGDYPDLHDSHVDYFTAVTDCLYGNAPDEIVVAGKRYVQVNSFVSSGETECPGMHDDMNDGAVTLEHADVGGKVCMLCEADLGEEHGYIYLGDGWCEVVYRHDAIEAMRTLAESHNLQVWEERITEVTCSECDSVMPVPHDSAHADSDVYCPSCEHKLTSVALADTDRSAWWWWCCSPGCLPEGAPNGPHDSEVDALEEATDGLAD